MTCRRLAGALAGALLIGAITVVAGPCAVADNLGSETKLPIPRFVSLRSNEVNLRTGPGTIYPVEWVFVRRGLPVEVVAEFDVWRRIRDWQGTMGWVHQSMLDGRRTVRITGADRELRSEPAEAGSIVVRLAPGVIGRSSRLSRTSNNSIIRVSMTSGSFRVTMTSGLVGILLAHLDGRGGRTRRRAPPRR